MTITFLIGNGFDLNLGLKTKYTDFLESYKEIESGDSAAIKYFKEKILQNHGLWANAEEAFGVATEQFHKDNFNAEDFCECHEDFCNKLSEYLFNQEEKLNISALTDNLKKGFGRGIQNYKEGFRDAEKEKIILAEKNFGGGFTYNFINFNYTNTVDSCVSTIKEQGILGKRVTTGQYNRVGQIMHVHGTLHRNMVLGVNDLSQIVDPSLFDNYDEEYINELIKQKTNEINEENTDEKVNSLLSSSDLIYIYGMSTGITDKLWWERICLLMSKKKNLHLIIHKFDAPEDGLIRRLYRLFVKNVRNDFLTYCNLEKDVKADIESRIHIDNTNIFDGLQGLVHSSANTIIEKEMVAV